MTATLVAVAAQAHADGRAIRQSHFLHRRLQPSPIGLVLYQLAGEPFSVAAIRYGHSPEDSRLVVCPDPRNRTLLFEALLPFAEWFCAAFEAPNMHREADGSRGEIATRHPQIVVANRGTLAALASLGRRTAYLSTSGEWAADAPIIALGRHLQWATGHRLPGQQVCVSLTDALAANWATPLSELEAQSLPALNAWIAPPAGLDGYAAADAAEDTPMGPLAAANDDGALADLITRFHRARRSEDEAVEKSARTAITTHWERIADPAWSILWSCLDRERGYPEAPSVERRVSEDRRAYTSHMDWQSTGGRRRASESVRRAVWLRHSYEQAQQRLDAEEAIDDPLRMVPYLVDGRAFSGIVVGVDEDHREQGPTKMVRRPLVVCRTDDPVAMPVGTELYWTEAPGTRWTVAAVAAKGDASVVSMRRESGGRPRTPGIAYLPLGGDRVTFSEFSPAGSPPFRMPDGDPWTHRAGGGAAPPAGSLEEAGA